jgi:hypothetical protein
MSIDNTSIATQCIATSGHSLSPRTQQPPARNPPQKMARKKLSTTIYITPEQNERLKVLHERTKVPMAWYIREGIDLALAKYEHLMPGQTLLLPADKAKP